MNLGAHVSFQIIGTRNYFNIGEITALLDAEGSRQEQSKSTCYRREIGEKRVTPVRRVRNSKTLGTVPGTHWGSRALSTEGMRMESQGHFHRGGQE